MKLAVLEGHQVAPLQGARIAVGVAHRRFGEEMAKNSVFIAHQHEIPGIAMSALFLICLRRA